MFGSFRLILKLIVAVLLFALVIFAILWQLEVFRDKNEHSITTGQESGVYRGLGEELAKLLNQELAPFESFDTVASRGSAENAERIASGEAQFGFVQSDGEFSEDFRIIASLYVEVLHVFVRADLAEVESVFDLARVAKVSLGPEGSGARKAAEKVLQQFEIDIDPAGRLAVDRAGLIEAFKQKEIDAAFVFGGPGTPIFRELLQLPDVKLVGFGGESAESGPAESFTTINPAYSLAIIPQRMYGTKPRSPITTIGVDALLVAPNSVDDDLVRKVASVVHNERQVLSRACGTPLVLKPYADIARGVIPVHAGATAFHNREQPSFLAENAELLSLLITLLVGAWSLSALVLRWLGDLKKERIDVYYAAVRSSAALESSDRLQELRKIHSKAFQDLMDERLAANDSFIIFHDYLLSEISRAERVTTSGA